MLDKIDLDSATKEMGLFKDWMREKMSIEGDYVSPEVSFSKEEFEERLKEFDERRKAILTSYLGTATHMYPVHLLSLEDFPWHLFEKGDEALCEIHFDSQHNRLTMNPSEDRRVTFHVSIPEEVFARYKDDMTAFKETFFQYLDVPAVQKNGIRRTLRLRLNTEWLANLKSRRDPQ